MLNRWVLAALLTLVLPALAFAQQVGGPVAPLTPEEHTARANDPAPRGSMPPRGYADDIDAAKAAAAAAPAVALPGPIVQDAAAVMGLPPSMAPSAPTLVSGFAAQTRNDSGFIPPDPVMASGPNNVVVITNGRANIYSKTGTQQATATMAGFFAPSSGEFIFDPKVLFDAQSQRFFAAGVSALNISNPCSPGACGAHFLLAVSKTDTPATLDTSSWFFYSFDATLDGATATSNWADYPQLGVDANVVVLTGNMFGFGNAGFQYAKVRIINKAAAVAGTATTFTDFAGVATMVDPGGFPSFTIQPALHLDSPGPFFLVSASRFQDDCSMVVWRITSTTTTPALSNAFASASGTCGSPPDAAQAGNAIQINTGDNRLMNAVYRNGSLWAANSIANGADALVNWFEINVSAYPSLSFNQNATFGAAGQFFFYPTLMVNTRGDMGMVMARSSASLNVGAVYTGRSASDPPNTLQPLAVLQAGTAGYSALDGNGRNRWGDYLGASLDPLNDTFWMLGEYATPSNVWGTFVGNFSMAPLVPDLVVPLVSAPTGAAGQPLAVTNRVRNQGTGTAGASTARIFLSQTGVIDGTEVLLGSRAVGSLAAGINSSAVTTVTVPANSSQGTYFVIVVADSTNAVAEMDETNNVGVSGPITILQPDLVVAAVTLSSATTISGGTVTVFNSIRNAAGAPTVAGASTARLFLSRNSSFDGTAILLASRAVPALAGLAFSNASTMITIPANTSEGSYFVLAVADALNTVAESDETNNLRASSSLAVAVPDLVVAAVSATPGTVSTGGTLNVFSSIRNIGPAPTMAGASTTRLYLSSDNILDLDGTDVLLGSRAVPGLAASAFSNISTTVTIPFNTSAGAYFVIAVADALNQVTEHDESNNVLVTATTISVVRPDLVVTNVTAPPTTIATGTITVFNAIRNAGPAPSLAPASTARFFLSPNNVFDSAAVLLGSRAVPSLAANAFSNSSMTLTIPANTSEGTYFVLVMADALNNVLETDETNNVRASGSISVAVPDLTVAAVTASPTPVSTGGTLSVFSAIKNIGPSPTVAMASTAQFFLSTDNVLDGTDVLLGSRAVPALAASAFSNMSSTVTIPFNTSAGTYFIIAVADALHQIAEHLETNNTLATATPITVVQPDLVVPIVTAPSATVGGGTISVFNAIRNAGPLPSLAPASTARLYLSPNNFFDGNAVLLGSRAVPSLAANAFSNSSMMLTVPANTSEGIYFVLVVADALNNVIESNEGNNLGVSGPITVADADLVVADVRATPSPVSTGGALTIFNSVRNAGAPGTMAGPSTVRFFLSSDAVLDGGDVLLGSRAVPSLAALAFSNVSSMVTIPVTTPAGPYFVIAAADALNQVTEHDDTNNTRATVTPITVVRPDLAVTGVSAPFQAVPGGTITVFNDIQNAGLAPSVAPASTARAYLSRNSSFDGTAVLLGSRAVPSLAAGAFSNGSMVLTLPANTSEGTYFVLVVADAFGNVIELDETNNVRASFPLSVVVPDLTVLAVSATPLSTVATGGTLTVFSAIRNIGPAITTAPPSTARFYLSQNPAVDGTAVLLGSRAVPSLAGNAFSNASTPFVVPFNVSVGDYFVIAVADALNTVIEHDETNNARATAQTVTVVRPDLTVPLVTAPASAVGGNAVSVFNSVQNIAFAPANAPASTLRLYVSQNASFDGTAILLGSRAVPALAARAFSNASTTVTLPATLSGGTYFVIAVADGPGTVFENDESNNVGVSGPITVFPRMLRSMNALMETTASGCTNSAFNRDFDGVSRFNITTQTLSNWTGSFSVSISGQTDALMFTGTVDTTGTIAGNLTFTVSVGGFVGHGAATFTGSLSGNIFTADLTGGHFTDGTETCTLTGTFTSPAPTSVDD